MSNKMKALLYILLDCVAMTGIIFFVKDTGKGIPIFEKIFFKNILSVIIVFFMLKKRKRSMLGSRENRLPMIARGIVGIVAVYLQFYSVTQMQLADSAVLIKTVPFFITIIAGFFLNERFRKVQIFSLILSFTGVLYSKTWHQLALKAILDRFTVSTFSSHLLFLC
jgi:drug/metabolite transporter (DMT)-like permease